VTGELGQLVTGEVVRNPPSLGGENSHVHTRGAQACDFERTDAPPPPGPAHSDTR
jgi:hypothetical protein